MKTREEIYGKEAALRGETTACRLRHLIYATTGIKKAEWLEERKNRMKSISDF